MVRLSDFVIFTVKVSPVVLPAASPIVAVTVLVEDPNEKWIIKCSGKCECISTLTDECSTVTLIISNSSIICCYNSKCNCWLEN